MKKLFIILSVAMLLVAFTACAEQKAEMVPEEAMQAAKATNVNGIFEGTITEFEEVGSQKFAKVTISGVVSNDANNVVAGENLSLPVMPNAKITLKDGTNPTLDDFYKDFSTSNTFTITVLDNAATEIAEK